MYRLIKSDHPRRSRDHSPHLSRELKEKIQVLWAEQQFHRIRQKRGYLPDYVDEIKESETELDDKPLVRVKRKLAILVNAQLAYEDCLGSESSIRNKRGDLSAPTKETFRFNDKLWDHQWYLVKMFFFSFVAHLTILLFKSTTLGRGQIYHALI